MQVIQNKYLIAILIIFHMVGLVGIMLPNFKDLILSLSFLNLLLAFVIILLGEDESKPILMKFLLIAFVIGLSVELIGIHTGLLFGDYKYGFNLGPKLWDVPLVIGINWGVLTVTAASVTHSLKFPHTLKLIYFALRKPNSNKVFNALFFIQFIFFIILNFR